MRTIQLNANRTAQHASNLAKVKSLVIAKLQYIAVSIAFVGGVIMCNAEETNLTQPLIGCGLIIIGALVAIAARKEASNG